MSQEVTTTQPSLIEIMTDEHVSEHMKRMFHVGVKLNQESGFAVYQTAEDYDVSQLLLPAIDTSKGFDDASAQTRRIDMVPLIRKRRTLYTLSDTEYSDIDIVQAYAEEAEGEDSHILSNVAARKIAAIEASTDITPDEKEDLIEVIRTKDMIGNPDYRNDVLLLSHNHPQPAVEAKSTSIQFNASDMIVPSPQDLRLTEMIRNYSPACAELIVAACRKEQKALLYSAKPGGSIDFNSYESRTNFSRGAQHCLGNLALSGAVFVILDLNKQGRLTNASQQRVREFEKELAA